MKTNEPPKLECVFYKTDSGVEPVRAWLLELPPEVRKKIGNDIRFIQYTWPVGRPRVGVLGHGLFEVRTSHFDNDYRVLFSLSEAKMLLLHGAQKPLGRADTEMALSRKRQADRATAERDSVARTAVKRRKKT